MTNAYEPSGEHVQEEAPQELRSSQSHIALLATVGVILPAESNSFLIESQQAMIGDGHTMGVAAYTRKLPPRKRPGGSNF